MAMSHDGLPTAIPRRKGRALAASFLCCSMAVIATCCGSERSMDWAHEDEEVAGEQAFASYAEDMNNIPISVMAGAPELRPIRTTETAGAGLILSYEATCPDFLGCETFRHEVSAALDAWTVAGSLRFVEANGVNPDIRISFEHAGHLGTCDDGFTSALGTLAHAYTAGCQRGEIHLNGDLHWSLAGTTTGNAVRYDVRTVILHETGHLLGLAHSDDPISVMHARYVGAKRRVSGQDAAAVADKLGLLGGLAQ